jgi:hypothetical protein
MATEIVVAANEKLNLPFRLMTHSSKPENRRIITTVFDVVMTEITAQ